MLLATPRIFELIIIVISLICTTARGLPGKNDATQAAPAVSGE
jgi:hypothetical protein